MKTKEFIIKLSGLNAMTVEAYGVTTNGGLIQFTGEPNGDTSEVIFTVNQDSLEYFGVAGEFELTTKR